MVDIAACEADMKLRDRLVLILCRIWYGENVSALDQLTTFPLWVSGDLWRWEFSKWAFSFRLPLYYHV
jgi:hypothetical protein